MVPTATPGRSAATTPLSVNPVNPEVTSEPTPAPESPTPTPTPTSTPVAPTPSPTQAPSTATSTPAPEPTAAPPTQEPEVILTITLAPVPAGIPEYDRSQWKHWTDADGDCQDARQEALIAESLDEVTFETDRQSRVESGRWFEAFDGHDLGSTGYVDIDHMVSLKNALDSK